MSYYVIEDIDSINPNNPFGYDGLIKGPFSSKRKALKWIKEDAERCYEGADEYRLDSGLCDRDYFSKYGLVKLCSKVELFAQARITIKLREAL